MYPGDSDAEDQTEKYAHIHHGETQQFGLPGAVKFAVDFLRYVATKLQIRRVGAEEHDKAHYRHQCGLALFIPG
ncbi:hypothetical protein D3C75_1353440 [compost metagenome]